MLRTGIGISPDDTHKIDNTNPLFPFAAVVNQEKAKEALLIAVINPAVHGVLFLGEKGTGKTTLVRSLSTLLPETQVIDLPETSLHLSVPATLRLNNPGS